MAKSILQKGDYCLVCHSPYCLEEHHVFEGSRRKASEKYGLKVNLCAFHHRISSNSVHLSEDLNKDLKKWSQRKAMQYYGWSEDDFIGMFGRNYI